MIVTAMMMKPNTLLQPSVDRTDFADFAVIPESQNVAVYVKKADGSVSKRRCVIYCL